MKKAVLFLAFIAIASASCADQRTSDSAILHAKLAETGVPDTFIIPRYGQVLTWVWIRTMAHTTLNPDDTCDDDVKLTTTVYDHVGRKVCSWESYFPNEFPEDKDDYLKCMQKLRRIGSFESCTMVVTDDSGTERIRYVDAHFHSKTYAEVEDVIAGGPMFHP